MATIAPGFASLNAGLRAPGYALQSALESRPSRRARSTACLRVPAESFENRFLRCHFTVSLLMSIVRAIILFDIRSPRSASTWASFGVSMPVSGTTECRDAAGFGALRLGRRGGRRRRGARCRTQLASHLHGHRVRVGQQALVAADRGKAHRLRQQRQRVSVVVLPRDDGAQHLDGERIAAAMQSCGQGVGGFEVLFRQPELVLADGGVGVRDRQR